MTLFASILAGLGLSQSEAAGYLDVRLDTVKSWSAGRNRVPDGVWTHLHALAERQEEAAQAIMDAWEESGRAGEIEISVPSARELARRKWPSEGAYLAVIRRAWELIGPEVKFELVEPGSTPAVRGAERARKLIE